MSTTEARSRIADVGLAPAGRQAIEWAARHSPVLDGFVRDKLSDGSLSGRRVAVVVHLEAKTAFLATVLADAGAEVVVAGSNPWTTRDEVAAALVERGIQGSPAGHALDGVVYTFSPHRGASSRPPLQQ